MALELRFYQTAHGKCPFIEWLTDVDRQARARVEARLARVVTGNLGDIRPVGGGVVELRIDWGPGYRVYAARVGPVMVLLLCGGDKRTQQKDIQRAQAYFKDHKSRRAKSAQSGRRT